MVKLISPLLIILLISSTTLIKGCPTCEGRVNEKSKTFFNDEENDATIANYTQGDLP